MLMLRGKKYSILTFSTKTEMYLIVLHNNNNTILSHAEYLRPSFFWYEESQVHNCNNGLLMRS